MKFIIVYLSPAGTTRRAARMIARELSEMGKNIDMWDLGARAGAAWLTDALPALAANCCLFVGTPVYASHALPAIMDFISKLPAGQGCCSVPFVTWGAVTSGLALHEMGRALAEKGYPPIAAAKIVAEHSLLWQSDNPLAAGRPDSDDEFKLRNLVSAIVPAIEKGLPRYLADSILNYQPEALQKIMAGLSVLTARKSLPQIDLQPQLCTQCGDCVAACPVDALELVGGPVFKDTCIACYNCLRSCRENALQADFTQMEAGLAQRVKQFGEPCETVIYLP